MARKVALSLFQTALPCALVPATLESSAFFLFFHSFSSKAGVGACIVFLTPVTLLSVSWRCA